MASHSTLQGLKSKPIAINDVRCLEFKFTVKTPLIQMPNY